MSQTQTNQERILIIDDDQDIWRAYRLVLSPATPDPNSASSKINEILLGGNTQENDSGFVLSFADQGQKGYQMVAEAKAENPFSLAFVDIRMPPGWDGMETAAKIRQLDPDIELVIVTAYSDRSMEEIVHAVGSPDKLLFLRKPFDADELKQIARAMTSKWRMAKKEKEQRQARLRIEEQLLQAQKMEAIGTLAGGIAHDFNNILSAIMGYTDLALMRIRGTHPDAESDLAQVRKAAVRATDLVRQILTFSRRESTEKTPLHLSIVVKEVLKLLRASIPATIDIRADINTEATILADATQMHQLTMNLCTNAFHAMTDQGGALTVALYDTPPDEEERLVKNHPLATGPYITLAVTDTGSGIEPTAIAKIFEPYFTTKEKGKGTGMGLAVAKGVVEAHRGIITVNSELGCGSTFKVYLPALTEDSAQTEDPAPSSAAPLSAHHERIMVVDDESSLRDLAYHFLTGAGYRVDLYTNAQDACEALSHNPNAWHLLVTDQTMPGMTGEQLILKSLELRPDLPIILCSGYSQTLTNSRIQELGLSCYLQKPIDRDKLLNAVADSLKTQHA